MQFSKLAFVAAIASVTAQTTVSISDLPTCALSPAVSAIGTTGCGTDIACVCKNSGFLTGLTPLIQAACSQADFQKAVTVAVQLCAQAGVTITPPTVGSSTAAPAPATSAAPASTSVAATTSAAAVTTTSVAKPTAVTTTTVPKNGTVSTSAVPSVVTANVAAVHGTWAAAGLLGVGALLAAL